MSIAKRILQSMRELVAMSPYEAGSQLHYITDTGKDVYISRIKENGKEYYTIIKEGVYRLTPSSAEYDPLQFEWLFLYTDDEEYMGRLYVQNWREVTE